VTPCVYAGLPVIEAAPRIFAGADHSLAPVSFGDVREGLLAARDGKPRRAFTAAFAARRNASYSALLAAAADDATDLPAPPALCRSCYEMWGA
jgi:hypothetical protein